MRTLSGSKIQYFDKSLAPAFTVVDGEEFWVDTPDCYDGQISEATPRAAIDRSRLNPATGPIFVEGAAPGDTLCVELISVLPGDYGIMSTSPGMGLLGGHITADADSIIHIKKDRAEVVPGIVLPLTPMVGVIGVAPAGEPVRTVLPGSHGGNLDCKLLSPGARLFLPVATPGAGLGVGDMHALMGDGEMSGTGVEVAGRVQMRVSVIKNSTITDPFVIQGGGLYALGSAADTYAACQVAALSLATRLMELLGLSFADTYRLLSAVGDLQICQVVNGLHTARVGVPMAQLGIDGLFEVY